MIAAGEGPHSGKMVCGQFGSFIPGFLASWDESIEEGEIVDDLVCIRHSLQII
jgi:5-oxoprolinase (ATP-hydrolysing)